MKDLPFNNFELFYLVDNSIKFPHALTTANITEIGRYMDINIIKRAMREAMVGRHSMASNPVAQLMRELVPNHLKIAAIKKREDANKTK
jgi:hypothetical protein